MGSLYEWIKFLHVIAAVAFMVAHGTSIGISSRLKKEQDVERIKAMLDVYHWAGHLPPAAPDARYAFPGRRQGAADPGTCPGRRKLRTDRKNETSFNDAGGLRGIYRHNLADDV
jgi:hypothetical protein